MAYLLIFHIVIPTDQSEYTYYNILPAAKPTYDFAEKLSLGKISDV